MKGCTPPLSWKIGNYQNFHGVLFLVMIFCYGSPSCIMQQIWLLLAITISSLFGLNAIWDMNIHDCRLVVATCDMTHWCDCHRCFLYSYDLTPSCTHIFIIHAFFGKFSCCNKFIQNQPQCILYSCYIFVVLETQWSFYPVVQSFSFNRSLAVKSTHN